MDKCNECIFYKKCVESGIVVVTEKVCESYEDHSEFLANENKNKSIWLEMSYRTFTESSFDTELTDWELFLIEEEL